MHTSYVFAIPMKEKSVKNVVPAYLSNILANKGGNIAILSNNRTEFKNTALNEESVTYSASKEYSQTCFTPKTTQDMKT